MCFKIEKIYCFFSFKFFKMFTALSQNLEINKTMVYQVSTRFLDHGLSFWKKIMFSSKKKNMVYYWKSQII